MAAKQKDQQQSDHVEIDVDKAFSSLVTAGDVQDYDKIKAMIIGATKVGKTHCASLFAKPLYGLCEKQAIVTVKRANPKAQVFYIGNSADLFTFKLMAKQAKQRGFDSVVLDSITDAQRILRGYYTARQGTKAGKDKTSVESWGSIIDATSRFARELRDLPVHVLVIALDEEVYVEGTGIVHRPLVTGKKLPGELGQYFSVVGHVRVTQQERGYRHEVMFRGDERYLIGAPYFLDNVEPPEPQWWISRMTGGDVPSDVQKRVDDWRALAMPEDADANDEKDGEATSPDVHAS